MVDMVNPTVVGTGSSSIDPVLAALLAGGGFGGFGGFGNRGVIGQDNSAVLLAIQQMLQNQTENTNVNSILTNLATIQQLIPENEGKVQLALAGAQAALANQASQVQLTAANTAANIINAISDSTADTNSIVRAAKDVSEAGFAAAQLAIANSTAATNEIVRPAKDTVEAGFAATQLSLAGVALQAANNKSDV